jgi:hypothetical protein
MLREKLAEEPQQPNGNMPLALQDEVSAAHLEWAKLVSALRLLIGVRLVNEALEEEEQS